MSTQTGSLLGTTRWLLTSASEAGLALAGMPQSAVCVCVSQSLVIDASWTGTDSVLLTNSHRCLCECVGAYYSVLHRIGGGEVAHGKHAHKNSHLHTHTHTQT